MWNGKNNDAITENLSFEVVGTASSRFKSFCKTVLKADVDDTPSQQSIFMRQSMSIVYYATIVFLVTNGFYLVKNIIFNTMIVIDMVPLYMMVGSCLAMLLYLTFCKDYGSAASRFVLLAFYTVVIAAVTVFMVSCNFHKIGLSISMCYLFIIMIAPTYKLFDTVLICILIFFSWWLPGILPYSDNYDMFKHFLLRFAIIAGLIAVRSVFIRQSANERRISEMNNSFVWLAYNDIMTGTLNKKAMEVYLKFVAEEMSPEKVGLIIYDVDNFKSYNDHYSHIKGDEALKSVAASVVGVLEKSDRYLFRFGGEEFVIVLPDVGEREAEDIAEELLDVVRAAAIPRDDLKEQIIVTATFGVACGTAEQLKDMSLITMADRQLYIGKSSGKNCVASNGKIYK